MKNISLLPVFILLFLVQTVSFGQLRRYHDSWSAEGFTVSTSTANGINIDYSIHQLNAETIHVDGNDMSNILLKGSFLFNEEGYPNLPGNGRFIAIPQGAVPKLRITASRIDIIQGIDIVPAPRIPKENEEGELEYVKNLQVYQTNSFYPENPVNLSAPSKIRGVDVVTLGITPFQYNPVTKELKIYRDLKVEVAFEGGNGQFGEERLRSRFWDPILEDALLNYSMLPTIDYNARLQEVTDIPGYEYLIITPNGSAFTQWADSIRRFRIQQGITTTVKTLADVGGNTTTAIETYLNNAYNTWTPAPAAVLLLGDYGTDANSSIISPIWNSYCVSDNIYGDVDGNHLPEMSMARITANNASQLQVMVTKFLNYERNPPVATGFYQHPISALGWQTERWFQICSEATGGFWKYEQLKDPVRINEIYSGTPGSVWSTATNTSTVVNYFGPSGQGYIPAAPSSMPCCWSGGNATGINNAINAGAFCLLHRDHGGETGWGEPAYSNSNISGLTNVNNQLPFIFSINCLTGKYNWSSECFTEKFHRYTYNGQNSGALGLIAASEVSYSFVNDTYLWGMMDNFWPDFMPDYGTTPASRGFLPCFGNAAGKYYLFQSSWPYNTSNKTVTYNLFHHHGDAFSVVYSEVPQPLSVFHGSTINAGTTTFDVTANNGSFIALSVGDQLLGTATGTGAPVAITIPGTLVNGQVMLVTVTMQNYFRYTSNVPVVPNGGPQPNFIADSTQICAGLSVDFTDLTTGNPISWSWSFPGGTPATSTLQNPENIVYSTTGTYNVTLVATNAISYNSHTKTSYITVNTPANINTPPMGDSVLCQNSVNTQYTVAAIPGGSNYNWVLSPDTAGVMIIADTSCIINWEDSWSGTAILKVQATNGCGAGPFSPEKTINVQPFPAIPGQPMGDQSLCQGIHGTSGYTVNPVPNATSYGWMIEPTDAGTISGTTTMGTVIWNPSFNGTAAVRAKAINQCIETLYSNPLDVSMSTVPEVNLGDDIIITQLQTATLDAGNPGASYLWSNGAVTQSITVGYQGNLTDTYRVDVTMNECTGIDSVKVTFTDPVGVGSMESVQLSISPNPSNGLFQLRVFASSGSTFDLSINDVLGKQIYEKAEIKLDLGHSNQTIDMNGVPAGLYYLQVTMDGQRLVRKIIINN